ncbi:MAG: BPL-N domain-containing protein, partial [Candidatus Thorarchaeota archaeon]
MAFLPRCPIKHLALLALLLLVMASSVPPVFAQTTEEEVLTVLSGVRVAVYYGDEEASRDSRIALRAMFEWMGAKVDTVTARAIIDEGFSKYDLVVAPGGWADTYIRDLGSRGIGKIRDFVADGGAFFGVCAGAYFACNNIIWEGQAYAYPLDIFNGTGVGPIEAIAPWPTFNMTKIRVNVNSTLIDLSDEQTTNWVMYYGGPYFQIPSMEDIEILATYDVNDEPAMIAFRYDEGRVFLSGPHPEWEEDSTRDNIYWVDIYDDNGTEWNMMLSVAEWLLENHISTTEPPPSINVAGLVLMVVGTVGVGASLVT